MELAKMQENDRADKLGNDDTSAENQKSVNEASSFNPFFPTYAFVMVYPLCLRYAYVCTIPLYMRDTHMRVCKLGSCKQEYRISSE